MSLLVSKYGVSFWNKWFVLLDQLIESSPFSGNYLFFVQAELSYLLLVDLGKGWRLGVDLYFFCK